MGLLWLLVAEASAWQVLYTEDGDPMRFAEMPVPWSMDLAESPADLPENDQRHALQNSFETWMGVSDANITFVQTADGTEDANPIHWVEAWTEDPNLLALTSTWATDDGEIVGFEIRINAAYDEWGIGGVPEKMDLQNAMTHEVGHALALDHSPEDAQATMYPTAAVGEVDKRDLDMDDEEAVRYLYGLAGAASGSGLFGAGCASVPVPSSGALASLPIAVLFFRRGRRASRC